MWAAVGVARFSSLRYSSPPEASYAPCGCRLCGGRLRSRSSAGAALATGSRSVSRRSMAIVSETPGGEGLRAADRAHLDGHCGGHRPGQAHPDLVRADVANVLGHVQVAPIHTGPK